MVENLKKASCGNCGNSTFEIYIERENEQKITAECTKCQSTSDIIVSQPKIQIEFGENSKGRLCILT